MMETTQQQFVSLSNQLEQQIVGQPQLIQRLLIALLADGHLLVEGAPGLAKTRAIRLLGEHLEGNFHRIQFTPDLLPADLTGTEIYRQQQGEFEFQKGPLFNNLVLADEINRAPAKVQSALLEAMAERQITVGKTTYQLEDPFLVMATQNPIEQEGTYPLPEAQLDRFLLHVRINYPAEKAEREILRLARTEAAATHNESFNAEVQPINKTVISRYQIQQARTAVLKVYLAEELENYLLQIILTTREPQRFGNDLAGWIQYGGSPRATIALDRCARSRAWLLGRDYVTPEDIQDLAFDVLRHRILLTYEAEAEGITVDRLTTELLNRIPIP
ncbi:MAG: AAA family ATPase [Desulfobacteraceae bacterium 4572_35.1]|nr:MAG: AAA family ATPase [Desulfobacteraceae bacterium 4572_35.1]